ncbi:prepilin-type N-terminal cleavage/methylation domain-containing protein [Limisalsivibrio acetivorans]|uniref:prepilin-type N-terminal cleavage/methylation domain-containing protein n=1 Tax=Limisalsivibrio acetivorans TaxID=1304888 RepID=UPI0003B7626E|nr:prepilin-type N-terminal cleavage/methylation domain-containing protein [Limisalsivibrio acetivorans]
MRDRRGFTLAELVIAVAVAAHVLVAAYGIFRSIIDTRDFSVSSSEAAVLNVKLTKVLSADFRQAVRGSVEAVSFLDDFKLVMETHNSLFFNGAIPVEVSYYVEDDDLFREERMPLMDFVDKMVIIPSVEDYEVLFHDGDEYSENAPAEVRLVRMSLRAGGRLIESVAGSYHDNTYINAEGIGQ